MKLGDECFVEVEICNAINPLESLEYAKWLIEVIRLLTLVN